MLLRISDVRTLSLNAFPRIDLVGPDGDGFFAVSLQRGSDVELLRISRNRQDALGAYNSILNNYAERCAVLDWDKILLTLYKDLATKSSFKIGLRDLEPRFRFAWNMDAWRLELAQMKELLAAMQAGKNWRNVWEPPLMKFPSSSTSLQFREKSVIADIQNAVRAAEETTKPAIAKAG